LYLLCVAVVLALLVLAAVAWEKRWGWPLACVLFSLLALNSLVVYLAVGARFLTFEIVLASAIGGILLACSRSMAPAAGNPLESIPRMEFAAAEKAEKKKGRKK